MTADCRIGLYQVKGRAPPGQAARVLAPLRAAPPPTSP